MTESAFLGEEEKRLVLDAAAEAGAGTSGAVVVVIADRAAGRARPEVVAASVYALPVALGAAGLIGFESMWTFLGVYAGLLVLFLAAVRLLPSLARPFAGMKGTPSQARDAAKAAFKEKGLDRDDKGAILLYALKPERSVWLLPNKAIHGKVADEAWNGIVADLERGVSSGRAADAMIQAVRRCGELLVRHFPAEKRAVGR